MFHRPFGGLAGKVKPVPLDYLFAQLGTAPLATGGCAKVAAAPIAALRQVS